MSTPSRRGKWHPTPPSPKILNLPRRRRTRRRIPKTNNQQYYSYNHRPFMQKSHLFSNRGKLESPFHPENDIEIPIVLFNSNPNAEMRERVEGENGRGFGLELEEERWRFQAEILRAECKFLRMEREFALKKLEKNRVKMERTLRSTIQTLVSGRDKIFEGKNVKVILDGEIKELEEKMEELKKNSRVKVDEVQSCSNFHKKVFPLQNQLEKLGGLSGKSCAKGQQELAEPGLPLKETTYSKNKFIDMDVPRMKMDGLSKGVLDSMEEEYMSMFSNTANSSVASSASISKRIDLCPEFSSLPNGQLHQEPNLQDENKCVGRCKTIISRIVEQVRAETEQWSQMQEMLGQVRGEMEELQISRDLWESRALGSDLKIKSLEQNVQEWKEKATRFENKANDLLLELFSIKEDIRVREVTQMIPLGRKTRSEKRVLGSDSNSIKELNIYENKEETRNNHVPPLSLGKHLAKEKQLILFRLKETQRTKKDNDEDISANARKKTYMKDNEILAFKRSPLQDIGNTSMCFQDKRMAQEHSQ